MKRVVVVICDGLRADLIRPDWTPNLCRLSEQSRVFSNHHSVFPSTTRTTAASIATGCHPARHGLEGNCVALDEGDGLVAISVGPAGFRERLKNATGQTLRVPTVSERLAGHGGGVIYSNVSPGAAYFHDPDGHGYVYHRSGSFGPGLIPITDETHLAVSHDAAGDTMMTTRFCDEVLIKDGPAYAVLWQCEPDHTQHGKQLGSPEHIEVIKAADANAGRVAEKVAILNAAGEDIVLIIASDHGHETVERTIPLVDLLVDAGLKDSADSHEIVVASNGLSANIYCSEDGRARVPRIVEFLKTIDGVGSIYSGAELIEVGHLADSPLAIAVTATTSDGVNALGIPGKSVAIGDGLLSDTQIGCGQHGGLGAYEQNPFLMISGGGFIAGTDCTDRTSAVDLAPTALRHLDMPSGGMDGRALPTQ